MKQNLDKKIKSKQEVLHDLTLALNRKRDEYEEGIKQFEKLKQQAREDYMEYVSELDNTVEEPFENLKAWEDRVASKEEQLGKVREEIDEYSYELAKLEDEVMERERTVLELQDVLCSDWKEYIGRAKQQIEDEWLSIETRTELLKKRSDMVSIREARVKDEYQTLQRVKTELDGKRK